MRNAAGVLILGMMLAGAAGLTEAAAVQAGDRVVTVELRDGSRLVGRVVSEDDASLKVQTTSGVEVTVPRASVVSITGAGEGVSTRGTDPNYSRLMFGPTARPLRKGDGYFADYELVFPGVAYGVTDNITIGGGISAVPGIGLGEQLFYISPKVGFELGPQASVAVGGLFAGFGDDFDDDLQDSLRIGYAVGTFGPPSRSATLGLGLANVDGETAPLLMVGGAATLSRHVALVAESWMDVSNPDLSTQPVGVAVRFFSTKLSADVGVILIGELLEEGFPLPWISVTYHFGSGPGRSARGPASSGSTVASFLPRPAR